MLVAVGHFLFRHRNAMFPLACLPLLLPGPKLFDDTLVASIFGALIAASGQAIRALTIGLRYVVRGGKGGRVYAEDLVTEGLYSHVRNPMYLGNLLIVAGVAVAANSLTTVIVGAALSLFMYSAIVAAEEQYLQERFGAAFSAYCRDVPRWLPRVSGLANTLSSMQFHWRRLLVKEYGTPFGWISVLAGVTLFRFWADGQWHARTHDIAMIGWTVAITTVLWFCAWRLKRSRTIVAD
jgi:protein-S-isoprenylcysteine O-methyltransferase Ste14